MADHRTIIPPPDYEDVREERKNKLREHLTDKEAKKSAKRIAEFFLIPAKEVTNARRVQFYQDFATISPTVVGYFLVYTNKLKTLCESGIPDCFIVYFVQICRRMNFFNPFMNALVDREPLLVKLKGAIDNSLNTALSYNTRRILVDEVIAIFYEFMYVNYVRKRVWKMLERLGFFQSFIDAIYFIMAVEDERKLDECSVEDAVMSKFNSLMSGLCVLGKACDAYKYDESLVLPLKSVIENNLELLCSAAVEFWKLVSKQKWPGIQEAAVLFDEFLRLCDLEQKDSASPKIGDRVLTSGLKSRRFNHKRGVVVRADENGFITATEDRLGIKFDDDDLGFKSIKKLNIIKQDSIRARLLKQKKFMKASKKWFGHSKVSLFTALNDKDLIRLYPPSKRAQKSVSFICSFSSCGKYDADGETLFQTCSACKFVRYCSEECQKAHWSVHKPLCKEARKLK